MSDEPRWILPALVVTYALLFTDMTSAGSDLVTSPIMALADGMGAGLTRVLPLLGFAFVALVGIGLFTAGADKVSKLPNPYKTSAFGERKRVEETETTVDECINCELNDVDGVERVARREQVLAGRVVRTLETTTVDECRACRDAETVEYGLRAEQDDPPRPDEQDDSSDDQNDAGDDGRDDLTRIKFVGDSVASNLRDAGFDSFDAVREADIDELRGVTGVGDQRASDIKIGANPVALELGFGVARRLADAGFDSVEAVREADVDDLTDARRVGKVTAKQVLEAVETADADDDQDDSGRDYTDPELGYN